MKRKIAFIFSCCFVLVLFVFHEYLLSFAAHPENYKLARSCLKFCMSIVPPVLALIGCISAQKAQNDLAKASIWITVGLFVCCAADVVINISVAAGAGLFLVGHVLFIRGFFCCKKPALKQIIGWILFYAAVVAGIFICIRLSTKEVSVPLKAIGVIYSIFMTAMVASSFSAPKLITLGSLIFGISDLLLIRNNIFGQTVVSHIISLGAYYAGVLIFAGKIFLGSGNKKPALQEVSQ